MEQASRPLSWDEHPCLSALVSCSALAPCEPCRVALATWVIPQALLAAQCGTTEQVGAFLDAYAERRTHLLAKIREAAVLHEEQIAATRAAFVSEPPPPSPPVPEPVPVAAVVAETGVKRRTIVSVVPPPPQTRPVVKKKITKAAMALEAAESAKAVEDLFREAVKVSSEDAVSSSSPVTVTNPQPEEKNT